ncbi:LapA family protein [Antarcticirhabdus aurantiaca]|uniref:LapA family protein n=1 Tax=Antarcticirhabdus aurantiaca TaxID=2606717 RepID=A0ACD4NQ87_9HYPH|nr:LapA family protein [Antarcticirhabdus aurantiaca]WAJ29032.1 LapA family protein [Jeongeuplla avenae]
MFGRILSLIILVPLAVLLVVFCVANRDAVPVSLDPLGTMPQFVFQVPLFILLMATVILGVVLGGIGTWFTQAHYRRKSWKRKYELEKLRREAEESRERLRMLDEERERTNLAGRPAPNGSALAVTSAGPSTPLIGSRAA